MGRAPGSAVGHALGYNDGGASSGDSRSDDAAFTRGYVYDPIGNWTQHTGAWARRSGPKYLAVVCKTPEECAQAA